MLPVARLGDKHACPLCKVVTPIVEGAANWKTDNKPTACVGHKTACGAVIVQGSSMSSIDGKPIAYLGCGTSHGGKIISGSANCKILP